MGLWNGTILAGSSDDYDEFDENSDTEHSFEMFSFADEFDDPAAPNLPDGSLGASLSAGDGMSAVVTGIQVEPPQFSAIQSGTLGASIPTSTRNGFRLPTGLRMWILVI